MLTLSVVHGVEHNNVLRARLSKFFLNDAFLEKDSRS